jgi:hypothetical protein
MTTDPNSEFTIEYQKLELEREKVRLERFKAWWTGISIIVPLLVAAISISFGMWSQSKQVMVQSEIQAQQAKLQSDMQAQQANLQAELQNQQARNQFEIKAAEIVMNTEGPLGALRKAKALANLFPDRLPSNFAESFDPEVYTTLIKKTSRSAYSKGQLLSNEQESPGRR